MNQGEAITVNCSYPNSTITWLREGTAVGAGFQVTEEGEVSSLTISSADPQIHTGQYVCRADLGMELSDPFQITVHCKLVAFLVCRCRLLITISGRV